MSDDRRHARADGELPAAGELRLGLRSPSFRALVAVQFLTVLNDNAFRWLVVPIGYVLLGPERKGLVLALGLACFVVPYILLAAPAGYLADRFSKRSVISGSMLLQTAILVLGVGAILIGSATAMFATLALMGAQGALLSPSKDGTIPEIIHPERVSAANGFMGMATVLAALAGSLLGNAMYVWTAPLGRNGWWVSAATLLGISLSGWVASLVMVRCRAADPGRTPPRHMVARTARDLRLLAANPSLFAAAAASALFWFLAALAQVNVYLLGTTTLHITQEKVGSLLAVLASGVACGSVLAGVWSGKRVDTGLTPIGAAGIAATSVMMFLVTYPANAAAAYGWSMFYLFLMGVASGLYEVPLVAYLQYHSPEKVRGQILAATNFLSFSAMLVASLMFWVMRTLLGESAANIFLGAGIITTIALVVLLSVLAKETADALARPVRRLRLWVRWD